MPIPDTSCTDTGLVLYTPPRECSPSACTDTARQRYEMARRRALRFYGLEGTDNNGFEKFRQDADKEFRLDLQRQRNEYERRRSCKEEEKRALEDKEELRVRRDQELLHRRYELELAREREEMERHRLDSQVMLYQRCSHLFTHRECRL